MAAFRRAVAEGIPDELPPAPPDAPDVDHAPARRQVLSDSDKGLALTNALRYFPPHLHERLAPEFAAELARDGRIYMRRYRPSYVMRARPIDAYPARSRHAAAIMLMIQNNLDPGVAQHPHELITYGGNGTVFQNWAQYRLAMRYLAQMTDDQTLVLYSGHPLGLFPSRPDAPRVVVTCGMVVPSHGATDDYERLAALGVTSYGQMTAGSFMYIGPQGIVHGTTITLLNAGRRYLGLAADADLRGRVFVTSGLGGMSGAQPKAAVIAGAICLVAEINPRALRKRLDQGWLEEAEEDLDRVPARLERARRDGRPLSLGYLGNVVDLWERLVRADVPVDLGSDQTSLHDPFAGGYYPVGMSFDDATRRMAADPDGFREAVRASLRRQVDAIRTMTERGMHFWDYGNAFLLEASRAGADVLRPDGGFRFPSYVEDIMGPICFDYGFGPFRWVCASGRPEDLAATDAIAADVLDQQVATAEDARRGQLLDNLRWIRHAAAHRLVVGSQARILYSDEDGRKRIALAFNAAIREGRISGPIVLGRDHHDVSGADSPYRETADVRDGSNACADMAVHNVIGDAFRGATWVSLHNGGGVGWGQAINGGFGMLIDGSDDSARRIRELIAWDVTNGLARRAWAGNSGARYAVARAMDAEPRLRVTIPNAVDERTAHRALSGTRGTKR